MDLSASLLHPTPTPQSEEDELAWIRLLRSRRVGVATFFRLLTEHGSAQAALEALPDVAAQAGVKDYTPCPPEVAEAEHRRARFAGARMVTWGTPNYPELLSEIADPPPFIWAMGDIALLHRPMVALIGARNASSIGLRMTRKLSQDLSDAGFTIVSGLARGVDTVAHQVALEAGHTIAVMAGGVDVIYPKENTVLAEDIGRKGLRLSEQPPGLTPQARHFPRRNRLISGLARAVVVVEAAAKSGSLITARNALDQGRDVLAVPGHPFDARASGCNFLIRDGAALVRGAQDVIDAIGPAIAPGTNEDANASAQATPPQVEENARPKDKRTLAQTAQLHSQILARLGPSPLAEDQLIRDLGDHMGAGSGDILPELVNLELEGRITRQPGGLLSRSQ
ncbi:DNA processing protein DprA [Aliiroseovarius zhejiangensis]|uniref:DNA processing protein DprA n=1 Tax=Aliiroseovarius zhejiangensis TaxID=1632025 RepID=A0ABQ3IQR3_9RHOB|nr:DNA-processing protein DprA [Aliiroseovarius zhejiangensis]GHE91735.1 DNA processing protein DprA [Aliiroseovarius zhejiangensis]